MNEEISTETKTVTPLDRLVQNGQAPKKVLTDAGTVHQFDLAEQIQLEKFRRSAEYADQPHRGLGVKLFKITPGGAPW